MGFGDKLKELKEQAQDAVAERKDQIHGVVDAVSVAANEKTGGKHTNKIAKFGQRASDAVDKFSAGAEQRADGTEGAAEPAAPAAPSDGPTAA
jgi:F0F1-type ATP synthase membrane subunit b/b'